MSTLPQIPLPVRCGEPLDVTVPVLDANNQPVSSSSLSSARAQVRARVGSATVLHEWTTDGSSPNAQIVSGGVRLTATAAETLTWQTDWPTPVPRWDLVVVDTAGNPSRLIEPSVVQLDPVLTRVNVVSASAYLGVYATPY